MSKSMTTWAYSKSESWLYLTILLLPFLIIDGINRGFAQDLLPRHHPDKPFRTTLHDLHRRDMVTVKFKDGLDLFTQQGRLSDRGSNVYESLMPLAEGVAQGRWYPVFSSLSEARLEQMRLTAQRYHG
ncbi:MAG: hypothetical protein O7G85_10385, partial [Planctomycetota bacterium]|nr:hypothetical protein [Planctomycetota bacterium]